MPSKQLTFPIIPPRWYQMPFHKAFDSGIQYSVISWPRRAGKDVTSFNALMSRAIQVPGNYYYLFPTRAWAQRALWDNICSWAGGKKLIDLLCPPELGKKNNGDLYIDLFNGSRIKIDGTDNLNFVGQGGAGYVLSEFSLHKPEVTGFLAPILTEGDAWVVFNGTLRGRKNHLWNVLDRNKDSANWFTQWYTLEDTKTNYWINEGEGLVINPELAGKISPFDGRPYKNIQDDIDSGLISFTMAKQEYLNLATNTVECSYYGTELDVLKNEGRFGDVDMDKSPVFTFWDIGMDDNTAIIFAQLKDEKFKIIDYFEASGQKIDFYAGILSSRGYDYGGHYGPHDVSRRTLFGDLITSAAEVGIDFRRVPVTKDTLRDIELCRRQLRNVSISARCGDMMENLEGYREGPSGKPVHNDCSHTADAFRTMIMADHHKLIEHYLVGGKRVYRNLPAFTEDSADEYAEAEGWDEEDTGPVRNRLLW